MAGVIYTFPPELGSPLLSGYQFGPRDVFRRIQVTDGPPRFRLNTPRYTFNVSAAWHWSSYQMALFRTWFDESYGWFNISLAMGGTDSTQQAFLGDPYRKVMQVVQAHFANDYTCSADNASGGWRVNTQLEVRWNPPALDQSDIVIDGGLITDPRPTDFVDSRLITEDRPENIIDAGTPSLWDL